MPLLQTWAETLWLGSLQSLPLLLLALALEPVFVRWDLGWPRRVVWSCVLLDLLLPPSCTSPWSLTGIRLALPAPAEPVAQAAAATFAIWSLGLVGVLGLGRWREVRLRRRLLAGAIELPATWRPLLQRGARRLSLRSLPRVVVSPLRVTPCTFGMRRPVVVLDSATLAAAAHDDDGRRRLEHVLLHELGHLRRRDALRAAVVRAVTAPWWFHPSAWLVARRFALFREIACDALVVRVLDDRVAYCRTLALGADPTALAPPAPGFARLPAEVVQRVGALRRRARPAAQLLVAAAAAVALMLCDVPLRGVAAPGGLPSLTDRQLADLPGCLQRRYYVLGRLAAAAPAPVPVPHRSRTDR